VRLTHAPKLEDARRKISSLHHELQTTADASHIRYESVTARAQAAEQNTVEARTSLAESQAEARRLAAELDAARQFGGMRVVLTTVWCAHVWRWQRTRHASWRTASACWPGAWPI
jgi:hypothetical protein